MDIELFGSLLSLYRKLDKWWINEIEISISADDIPKDYDPDEVVGGQAIVLSAINDILLGNQGERYKEILTIYNEKFVTAFFHTKVYLLAQASIFVPSMNIVFPEISPRSNSPFVISASILFAQGAKWMLRNLAKVA